MALFQYKRNHKDWKMSQVVEEEATEMEKKELGEKNIYKFEANRMQ